MDSVRPDRRERTIRHYFGPTLTPWTDCETETKKTSVVAMFTLMFRNKRVSNLIIFSLVLEFKAAWRNGIASDYESGDCRFDPCGGHYVFDFLILFF